MKVAVIYNKKTIDPKDVINVYGLATREYYSPKTVNMVAAALEKGGHTVKIIEGTMAAIDQMQAFMPKTEGNGGPGIVFNMAYGIQGHDRYTHLPAMLEMLGVPYTGSGPEAHAIVQDKVMTKIVLQKNNIPTANFWVFSSPDDTFDDIAFPVIVKPKMESTSMGMQIVYNWDDLRLAVKDEIDRYQQDALVEQFIPGREFAVGLLGNRNHLEVLPIVEFSLSNPGQIQTKSNKIERPIDKICPANIDPDIQDEMKSLCIKAFDKLGLHDYSRVDIRMDEGGSMYILELNSMASLAPAGSFVKSAKTAGYTYESLINKILDVAAVRYFGESHAHGGTIAGLGKAQGQPWRTAARSYLRSHLSTTIQLLRQMLDINTSVRNMENVNRLGGIISKRLTHMGFVEHIYRQIDVGNIRYFANHAGRSNDVLLLCHTDTPYYSHDFSPFREDRGKIFGSGVAESKGGIAVMLSALQALRFTKRLRKVRCGILVTTDDSLGGMHSKNMIEECARHSKLVLGLKWGGLDGSIVTSAYGRDDYKIEISDIAKRVDSAMPDIIPQVAKKIISLNRLANDECHIHMTSMRAQTSYGNSLDYASLYITANFITNELGDMIDTRIRHILRKQEGSNVETEIVKGIRRPPVLDTQYSGDLYDTIKEQAKQVDVPIKASQRLVSSDIGYVPDGIPSLEGLGPLGAGYRSPSEYILLDSLVDRALLLAMIIYNCQVYKAGHAGKDA